MRKRNYYRHQRKRAINKKLHIVKDIWGTEDHPWAIQPGRLSKAKLNCGCEMCNFEKIHGIPTYKNKSKLDTMEKEMKDFFSGDTES